MSTIRKAIGVLRGEELGGRPRSMGVTLLGCSVASVVIIETIGIVLALEPSALSAPGSAERAVEGLAEPESSRPASYTHLRALIGPSGPTSTSYRIIGGTHG